MSFLRVVAIVTRRFSCKWYPPLTFSIQCRQRVGAWYCALNMDMQGLQRRSWTQRMCCCCLVAREKYWREATSAAQTDVINGPIGIKLELWMMIHGCFPLRRQLDVCLMPPFYCFVVLLWWAGDTGSTLPARHSSSRSSYCSSEQVNYVV
jgi:hypothetical protein